MRLTILGSGTGWITKERSSPAYLLSKDFFHLLLDIGPSTLKQLYKLGFSLNDIAGIFISHFHPDHISDLIPFLFATRYKLGYNRKEGFILIAHKNFAEFYENLKTAFKQWICPPEDLFQIFLIEKEDFYEFNLGPFKAKTVKVFHNPESLAIRLETAEKSIVYSGDTGFSEKLIELAKGSDFLILECANSLDFSVEIHLGPQDIAQIAGLAKPKRLLLSHFYPHSENPPLEMIQKYYEGEIILARDFLTLEI